jgi:C4-dicarboxylate transporter/malic acid transport protein
MRLHDVIQNFNPSWFASVMGTAVIPLALGFGDLPFKMFLVTFFVILSVIMFLAALVPWTLKFIFYPDKIQADFNHPLAANFFPTMPISLVLFSLILLRYPDGFFSAATSRTLAFWLWGLGTAGIYLMGFIILSRIFRNKQIQLAHSNFGWFIPPVSKIIITLAGLELAEFFPGAAEVIFCISMVSFGVGFFLFLFVGAAVYHRYVYHELPISRLAPTFFIGLAPTTIMAAIFFKAAHFFEKTSFLGITPEFFTPFAKIAILFNWGFSAWWFVMAILVIIFYFRKLELPYALSWWAFTFPSGALTVASGVAWKITNFSFLSYFYETALIFLLAVWLVVFIRTGKGILSGKVFAPSH